MVGGVSREGGVERRCNRRRKTVAFNSRFLRAPELRTIIRSDGFHDDSRGGPPAITTVSDHSNATKFDAAGANRTLLRRLADTFMPVARGNPLVTFRFLGELGRLGNQLFQIAATIGVARSNACPFVLPQWDYARHFAHPFAQSAARWRARRYRERDFAYQEIVIDRPTELYGYFQSERYFQHCADEIRGYFEPHPRLAAMLRHQFSDLIDRDTCSVHVRRGDYVENPGFVDLSATDYHARAFQQFGPATKFVVFSDDLEWCRANFTGARFVFIEALSDIEDLILMSWCRGHIIANSSMSWWGAWLDPRPGKMVIAPARWFAGARNDPRVRFHPRRDGKLMSGYFDARDLIPQGWIKL